MKNYIKRLINLNGFLIHFILPYKRMISLQIIFNHLYSSWIKQNFKKVGTNFYTEKVTEIKGGKHVEIGDNFFSLKGLRVEAYESYSTYSYKPSITIGNNVIVNYNLHIGCISSIKIGDNTLIGSNVLIIDHNHGSSKFLSSKELKSQSNLYSKGGIKIGDNVWIGENVCILAGVTIGNNSVIGCNAVVTKSFKENSIIGGIPAKKIN